MTESAPGTLYVRSVSGRYRPAPETAIVTAAAGVLERRLRHGPGMSAPRDVARYLQARFHGKHHEVFAALVLDYRGRLIRFLQLFRGTLGKCEVHPREVVKEVLALNGAFVILAHNHPSGDPTPSQADVAITRRIKAALELVEVTVWDHIIVGRRRWCSLAEKGLL